MKIAWNYKEILHRVQGGEGCLNASHKKHGPCKSRPTCKSRRLTYFIKVDFYRLSLRAISCFRAVFKLSYLQKQKH